MPVPTPQVHAIAAYAQRSADAKRDGKLDEATMSNLQDKLKKALAVAALNAMIAGGELSALFDR